jgi:hypothetical protein
MATHNILEKLRNATAELVDGHVNLIDIPSISKHAIIIGDGAPDNTDDVGLVYIRTDGSNGDEVLYTWDATAGQWDAMTA